MQLEEKAISGGIYWGYLRAVFRESKMAHSDESKAMYDMVRMARIDGCPDEVMKYLVKTLRENGDLTICADTPS